MWYWICLIVVLVFSIGSDWLTDELTWGKAIWWSLLAVIPTVNVLAAAYLLFMLALYHGMDKEEDDG